jgi:hypothetical protein
MKIITQTSKSVLFGVISAVFFCIEGFATQWGDLAITSEAFLPIDWADLRQELGLLATGGRWNEQEAGTSIVVTLQAHVIEHFEHNGIQGYTSQQALYLTQKIIWAIAHNNDLFVQVRRKMRRDTQQIIQRDFSIPINVGIIQAAYNAAWPGTYGLGHDGVLHMAAGGGQVRYLHIYMTGHPDNGGPNNGLKVTTVFLSDH